MSTQPPEEETEQPKSTQAQDKGDKPPEGDPKKEDNPEYTKALEEVERLKKLKETGYAIYYYGRVIYDIKTDEEKQEILLQPAGKDRYQLRLSERPVAGFVTPSPVIQVEIPSRAADERRFQVSGFPVPEEHLKIWQAELNHPLPGNRVQRLGMG